MSPPATPTSDADPLLAELRRAVVEAHPPPREIEVGIALSIVLGRQRPSVACGGCQTPLEFEGIPVRTNPQLGRPFRLVPPGADDAR